MAGKGPGFRWQVPTGPINYGIGNESAGAGLFFFFIFLLPLPEHPEDKQMQFDLCGGLIALQARNAI